MDLSVQVMLETWKKKIHDYMTPLWPLEELCKELSQGIQEALTTIWQKVICRNKISSYAKGLPRGNEIAIIGEEKQLKYSNVFLIGDTSNSPFCPASLFFPEEFPKLFFCTYISHVFSYLPYTFLSLWQRYLLSCTHLMYTNEVQRSEAVIMEDLLVPLPRHNPTESKWII